ncbi:MAG: PCP reductase family protein [Bryobacterales bacterium]|nr:PCP reductase family protein [Bryobacterales bacterium]
MDWNEAAEELLDQILMTTPLPVREQISARVRERAESIAEEEGKARVGTNTVVAAWVDSTPEALRSELPRQMERLGLDPAEYGFED